MPKTAQENISNSIFTISNISEFTTFTLIVGFTYSVTSLFFYYTVLLNIPISQFLDATEILFMFTEGILFSLFIGSFLCTIYVVKHSSIKSSMKALISIVVLSFMLVLFNMFNKNRPITGRMISQAYEHWLIIAVILVSTIVSSLIILNQDRFNFKKIFWITILLGNFLFAIAESLGRYYDIKENSNRPHIVLKLKDGEKVETTTKLIYVGGTKNYWFFLNNQTNYIRVLRNDDISVIDIGVYLK
jgi:hypothetical protein